MSNVNKSRHLPGRKDLVFAWTTTTSHSAPQFKCVWLRLLRLYISRTSIKIIKNLNQVYNGRASLSCEILFSAQIPTTHLPWAFTGELVCLIAFLISDSENWSTGASLQYSYYLSTVQLRYIVQYHKPQVPVPVHCDIT